ncbi:MAG: DNA-binding response regulator, partial [Bacteroidetes bacterium]
LLLDIHLADGSSFEIFRETEITCPVIFTTAYDQYAIQAFKVNSIDYLLKPIKKEELLAALQKYHQMQEKKEGSMIDFRKIFEALPRQREYQKRVLIRFGQHIKAIEIAQAAYFFLESKITLMRTHDGKDYPLDYNLEEMQEMLDPGQFFRINRKYIVNISAIDQMFAYSKSRVKLLLKPPCQEETIVSAERAADFREWLTGIGNS